MITTKYDDLGTINSVKILPKIDVFDKYIKLYTEIDSHVEIGDKVFITLSKNVDDISSNSITLDNRIIAMNDIDFLYSTILQGYEVLTIDKKRNSFVINKLLTDIIPDGNIDGKVLEEHFVSKVTCEKVDMYNAIVDSTFIKNGNINNDGKGTVVFIQCVGFGLNLNKVNIKRKYTIDYITLNSYLDSDNKIINYFSLDNNNYGYSNFRNTNLYGCNIDNGYFYNCILEPYNIGNIYTYDINGGYFEKCLIEKANINNGYYKDVINLIDCVWNNGSFDCGTSESDYKFNLDNWYNGLFINGIFGSCDGFANMPVWHDGTFMNGIWDSYLWKNGSFDGGIFGTNGNYNFDNVTTIDEFEYNFGITKRDVEGNIINDISEYEYTNWQNGVFNGGLMIRTKWLNGTLRKGVILDSNVFDITMDGGLLMDVIIKKGDLNSGYIMNSNKSVVINECVINDITIKKYDNYVVDNNVSSFFSGYTNISSTDTMIFINYCYLISPIITDYDRTILANNTHKNNIFIGNQKSIQGGNYYNIDFYVPQEITTDICENCKFSVYKDNGTSRNDINISFGYISSLSSYLSGTTTISKNIMVSYTNYPNVFDNVGNFHLYDFSYLSNYYRTFDSNINGKYGDSSSVILYLNNPNSSDIYLDTRSGITIGNDDEFIGYPVKCQSDLYDYVILDTIYEPYMFGDYGLILKNDAISLNKSFIINDGVYKKCRFQGYDAVSKVIINNGIFNGYMTIDGIGATIYGATDIYDGNFNNIKLDLDNNLDNNSNNWYGGNFNSGDFGSSDDINTTIVDEIVLYSGTTLFHSGVSYLTDTAYTYTGDDYYNKYELTSIHPLIINSTSSYRNLDYGLLNAFDDNEIIHSTDNVYYGNEYRIDVWNKDYISFESGISWSADTSSVPNGHVIPSYFVFELKCKNNVDGGIDLFNNMLKFLQRANSSFDIGITDVLNKLDKNNNSVYNTFKQLYHVDSIIEGTNDIEINNHNYKVIDIFSDLTERKIAILFKFEKIHYYYNNTNDDILTSYDTNYKNVWSDANEGYSVRPMPVFDPVNSSTTIQTQSVEFNEGYNIYPLPTNISGWQKNTIPPPWFYDNNGILFYPFDYEYRTGVSFSYYNVLNYSNYWIKNYFDGVSNFNYSKIRKEYNNIVISGLTSMTMDNGNGFHYLSNSINIENSRDIYAYKMYKMYSNMIKNTTNVAVFDDKTIVNNNLLDNPSYLYYSGQTNSDIQFGYGVRNVDIYTHKSWEPYVLNTPSYDYDNIIYINNSWLYYNENSNILNIGDFVHVRYYDTTSTHIISTSDSDYYDISSKILIVDNVNNRINIDVPINESYGEVFSINPNAFSNVGVNMTILGIINYSIITGSILYVYSNSYKGPVVVLSSDGISNITIATGKTGTIAYDFGSSSDKYIYGLDEWIIDSTELYSTELYNILNVNKDSNRIGASYTNGIQIPSNLIGDNWIVNNNFFIKSHELNYLSKGYVEGTIQTINRITEEWNGMYLYGDIEVNNFNYLYSDLSINESQYLTQENGTWINSLYLIADNISYDLLGNYIEFSSGVNKKTNDNSTFKKVTGSIIRSNNILTFNKTTRNCKIYKNTYTINDTSVIYNYFGKTDRSFYMNYDDGGNKFIVGKYYDLYNSAITFETMLNIDSVNYTGNTSIISKLQTMDILTGDYGHYMEFKEDVVDGEIRKPINGNKIYYVQNGNSYLLSSLINSNLVILSEDGDYYFDTLVEFDNVSITTNTNIPDTFKRGYIFFLNDIGVISPCYEILGALNDGDPSKLINGTPKQKLYEINQNLVTDEQHFYRQAGLIIKSIGLNNQDELDITSKNKFENGNFYSGLFYSIWDDGNWYANESAWEITAVNNYNSIIGKSSSEAPDRKYYESKNLNDIINTLTKKGEYYSSPPIDVDKEEIIIIKPPITRWDEQ
ncbi:hypothetical protein M0Q50_04035 [bacterium]|jgi:uncharacterized protein YjbI with pentapeptide repeats|nr:hypothetical protein [bacterium]